MARHRAELDLLKSTADADRLTEEELLAWTRALNGLRLVLGTFLDVQEGDEGRRPASAEESLYRWLTHLLGEAIDALAGDALTAGAASAGRPPLVATATLTHFWSLMYI